MKEEKNLVKINSREGLVTYISVLFGMLQNYPTAMTLEQVQEVLNIKEKQAYKKVHTGELPSIWIGNGYRVLKLELVIYLAEKSLDLTYLDDETEEEEAAS